MLSDHEVSFSSVFLGVFPDSNSRSIASFLDRPDVRSTIGVDSSFTGNFSGCNNEVNKIFYRSLDMVFPAQFYIAALLERGVRALIYVGANDWSCNWVRTLPL